MKTTERPFKAGIIALVHVSTRETVRSLQKQLLSPDCGRVDDALQAALNAAGLPEGCLLAALNFALPADGSVPEWLELIPAGQTVAGRDGRAWLNDAPDSVLAAFNSDGRDIPLDWEHATELLAPKGHPAPAAAWGKALQLRDGGAIWGQFEWTERGRASVANREYRYISPVFIYETATGRIRRISSVALTNKPNLKIKALNHQQSPDQGEHAMTWKELLALLGLAETDTEAQAINAVKKLQGDLQTALNRADTPSLDKFVPRADYDAAVARATNAETVLQTKTAAELDSAIDSEVSAALAAGKITPATAEYHKANCRAEGGLDRFRAFVAAAPVVGDASGLDGKRPAEGSALNAEETQVIAMLGLTVDEYKKYNPAQ